MAAPGPLASDDELAVEPLVDLGWTLEFVPWRRRSVEWRRFDLVVVRSTWDYHRTPSAYLDVLATIDRETALENQFGVIAWNLNKRYMADLSERGVSIVPTCFGESLSTDPLEQFVDELGGEHFVLKPAIGASAEATFRLSRDAIRMPDERIGSYFLDREYLLQPYLPQIEEEGEYSVLFFSGEYSHTVLKTTRSGDFRVQEEHGGGIRRAAPDAELLRRARGALEKMEVERPPLYARVDMIRTGSDYLLMELELIEPALFLAADADAPQRFARALVTRFDESQSRK